MSIRIDLCKTCNWIQENGFSAEEEAEIYDAQLDDIIANTGFYLDNLEYMIAYRVSWNDYRSKTATMPKRFVKSKVL